MEKFIPQSPDPYLKKEADMSLAKFGHLNAMLLLVNAAKNNIYADNTAALAGNLVEGDIYSTATGEVRIVV
jgi:hypothetical protein